MSVSGAEFMENKIPGSVRTQTMEREDLRREKTIKQGLTTNARRALFVGLMDEQKSLEEVRNNWMYSRMQTKAQWKFFSEHYSKEKDKNKTKK